MICCNSGNFFTFVLPYLHFMDLGSGTGSVSDPGMHYGFTVPVPLRQKVAVPATIP
jgi:hypothetical protein